MESFKVAKLTWYDEVVCFSIESGDESQPVNTEEIDDIIKDSLYETSGEDVSLNDIADAVYYALSDAGYIVRNIPDEYEKISYSVEHYRVGDYDRE